MRKIALLITVISLLLLSACTVSVGRGSGNIVSEDRAVSGFTRISFSGGGEMVLTQAEEESLKVEADDNLLPYIETFVRNGELIIRIKPTINFFPSKTVKYLVSLPELEGVSVSGGGKLRADELAIDTLDVSISGGGRAEIGAVGGDQLTIDSSGGSWVYISDLTVDSIAVEMSGGGKFQVDTLKADLLEMDMSGGSEATDWSPRCKPA